VGKGHRQYGDGRVMYGTMASWTGGRHIDGWVGRRMRRLVGWKADQIDRSASGLMGRQDTHTYTHTYIHT